MNISKTLFLSVVCCVGLTACNSSGSSSGAAGVVYAGSTSPAVITAANADALAGSAAKGSTAGSTVAAGAVSDASNGINVLSIAKALVAAANSVDVATTVVATGAVQQINQTINGADFGGSGTLTFVGSIDDVTGYGSLTVTFNQFNDGAGTIINGSMSMSTSVAGSSLTFTTLSVQDVTGTTRMSGNINTVVSGSSETLTMNFVVEDATGQAKLENFVLTTNSDVTGALVSESISGRFYDSVDGYIDISTTSPLVYSPAGSINPSSGGPLIATGANNTKLRMTPVDAFNVLIEADTTGDGNYDYSVQKAWSAL